MRRSNPQKFGLWLLAAVMIASALMAVMGIRWLSQQRAIRRIRLQEELRVLTEKIVSRYENDRQREIQAALEQFNAWDQKILASDEIWQIFRDYILKYQWAQYPFVVSSRGEMLFPPPRRPSLKEVRRLDLAYTYPGVGPVYRAARKLAAQGGHFEQVITMYLSCLKRKRPPNIMIYIYLAVAEAYEKNGKYIQALSYLREIGFLIPDLFAQDPVLYFAVWHRRAVMEKNLDLREQAEGTYLQFYEKIVEYETNRGGDEWAALKAEAQEFLGQKVGQVNANRSSSVPSAGAGRRQYLVPADWEWVLTEPDDPQVESGSGQTEESRNVKLRELFIPTDEKSDFYRRILSEPSWRQNQSPGEGSLKLILKRSPSVRLVFWKRLPGLFVPPEPVIAGFLLSESYLRQALDAALQKDNSLPDGVHPGITDRADRPGILAQPGSPYPICVSFFRNILPGRALALYSGQRDYLERQVNRELWLSYGLIGALALLFVSALVLAYQNFARDAQWMKRRADFLDRTAHTLKTPLTRLSLLAENLEQHWVEDPERQREYLQTIIQETRLLDDSVNNLLSFSRIEAGRSNYSLRKGLLQDNVLKVIEELTPLIYLARFQLETSVAKDLPPLSHDPAAVRLILQNLVQNALKYASEKRWLAIRLAKQSGMAVLEVEDQGIGIDKKDLSHLGERFFRSADPRVRSREGSGLGLYLVNHAVRAHGGRLEITSRFNQGISCKIYFPWKK